MSLVIQVIVQSLKKFTVLQTNFIPVDCDDINYTYIKWPGNGRLTKQVYGALISARDDFETGRGRTES